MERSGLSRWLLLGLIVFLGFTFIPTLFGDDETTHQPLKAEGTTFPAPRSEPKACDIWGPRFRAQFTTQGGTLKHFELLTAKYRRDDKPIDLSTTPDVELRRQLRFHWRNDAVTPANGWQLDYDSVDYRLTAANGQTCSFLYEDEKVRLTRVIRATERPYELQVEETIENISKEKRDHALSVETAAWRTNQEVAGHMFRVSPYITHAECALAEGGATRLGPGDFEPDDFEDEQFRPGPLNPGDWFQEPKTASFAAVSNAYFSHAVVPLNSPSGTPVCQIQIEDRWDIARYPKKGNDPSAGAVYRARMVYPVKTLGPGESTNYTVLAYAGPKERDLLAAAGGGKHDLSELIDLGFFSVIAKVLVAFLLKVYSYIPNWGIAIILLTITARTLLFPLSVPSIKSMIKMRELKPELDALTAKHKDDAQARGLAQMELWRKHNVNPLKGCLPQMASMPVWFALYTTLQTAVELYNIPFLWFPDLSEPDPLYILPFVIGATSFVQQKIIPMQGDPTQQKMMLYFMPAMFTVFMLFLPAGLGVYMFTNSLLGIVQQLSVETYVKRSNAKKAAREIKVEVAPEETAGEPKGKKRKTKKGSVGGDALLGKGKA